MQLLRTAFTFKPRSMGVNECYRDFATTIIKDNGANRALIKGSELKQRRITLAFINTATRLALFGLLPPPLPLALRGQLEHHPASKRPSFAVRSPPQSVVP